MKKTPTASLKQKIQNFRPTSAATQEETEKLRGIFQSSPDAILVLDLTSNILDCNKKALDMLAYKSKKNLLGKNAVSFLIKTDRPRASKNIRRVCKTDSLNDIEYTIVSAQGKRFPVLVSASTYRNAIGKILGLMIVVRDISVRKLIEEENRRLAKFPAENPNPVLRLDPKGMILYANEASQPLLKIWHCTKTRRIPNHLRQLIVKTYASGLSKPIECECGQQIYEFTLIPIPTEGYLNLYGRDITKRKQIERVLHQSEEKYRHIVETTAEGIWITDARRKTLFVNQRMAALLGYTKKEMLGKSAAEFMAKNQDQAVLKIRRKLKVGINTQQEFNFQRKDGSVLWMLSNATPVLDAEGRHTHTISMLTDITDRREKEAELHKLNRTLQALSNSNQAMIYATDESAYLQEICRIIVKDCGHTMVWIGYTEDDEYKTVRPVAYAGFEKGYMETLKISWADTERGRGPTGTAIRTGKPYLCKNMLTDPAFVPWRKDAIKRGYASSLVIPLIADRKIFGAINIYSKEPDSFLENEVKLLTELATDLAYGIANIRLRVEHAKAEAILRQSEERYHSLFNSMTEGFAIHEIICDPKGTPVDYRFLDINPAFETLTGLKRDQVVGKTHLEIPTKHDPNLVAIYGPVALTGKPVHFENYSPTLKKHFEVFAYRPGPNQFAALFMDISKRKQAEEILKRDKETLEKLARAKSEELIGTQLELERSKRLSDIGTLAATVAHELRNPLAAITLAAANIKRKAPLPALEQNLGTIQKKISESEQIINNLLFYSRLRPPQLEKTNIKEIIEECLELMEEQFPNKKIAVIRKFEPSKDILLQADSFQLKEVFSNLLINAYDAIFDSTGQIEVGIAENPESVQIYFKDNGGGIKKEDLEKIFDPFFTTKAKGTGLGLTVCRQIITLHNGQINVASEINKGSTITVTLPILN